MNPEDTSLDIFNQQEEEQYIEFSEVDYFSSDWLEYDWQDY